MTRRPAVVDQTRTLGVREAWGAPGAYLLAGGTSRRGGAEGLVAALWEALSPEGTLVLPSTGSDDDAPYDPKGTPVGEVEMAVYADTDARG